MDKTVFSKDVVETLIQRIKTIQPDTTSKWGNMTPSSMMYHCTTVNNAVLNANPSLKKPTFKQKLLKYFIFKIKKQLPKGIFGSRSLVADENANLNYEIEQSKWIATLSKFPEFTGQLACEHPVFGALNNKEWGHFIWLRLDHYLRQFGA